jgi:predicted enzyme related to lactoylglutathione lyase
MKLEHMNLISIRIITDDVTGLADFYEKITGVTAERQGNVFAEVRTASGTLAIGSTRTVALFGEGSVRPADNHTAIIEFLVDDVDAEFVRLKDWLDGIVTEPTTMPWGNRSLLFHDPDGTLVNLFCPVTPDAIEKFARYER